MEWETFGFYLCTCPKVRWRFLPLLASGGRPVHLPELALVWWTGDSGQPICLERSRNTNSKPQSYLFFLGAGVPLSATSVCAALFRGLSTSVKNFQHLNMTQANGIHFTINFGTPVPKFIGTGQVNRPGLLGIKCLTHLLALLLSLSSHCSNKIFSLSGTLKIICSIFSREGARLATKKLYSSIPVQQAEHLLIYLSTTTKQLARLAALCTLVCLTVKPIQITRDINGDI